LKTRRNRSPYQRQLAVKKQLILSHPDGGEAVWRRFVSALDSDHKPPQARDWR
jgi:hypothetical protein